MRSRYLLLAGVTLAWGVQWSLRAAEPEVETDEDRGAVAAEKALLEEMDLLWKKIGSHAEEGSQLAKDNRMAFDRYYRSLAERRVTEMGVKTPQQEIFSLMCIPCAYGWPMFRAFDKDTKYTGLFLVNTPGDHEVIVDIDPPEVEVEVVLEVDGKAIDKMVKTNQKVTLKLDAGVIALTVKTNEDVHLHFGKLHLSQVETD